MNRPILPEPWADYLNDPCVSVDDAMATITITIKNLGEMLSADSELRAAAVQDAELHGLLRGFGRVDAAEDPFVERVLQQICLLEESSDTCARALESPEPIRASEIPTPPPPPTVGRPIPPPISPPAPLAVQRPGERTGLPWSMSVAASLIALATFGLALLIAISNYVAPSADEPGAPTPIAEQREPSAAPSDAPSTETTKTPTERVPRKLPVEIVERPQIERPQIEREASGLAVDPAPNPPAPTPDPQPSLQHPKDRAVLAAREFGRIIESSSAVWDYPIQSSVRGEPLQLRAGAATIAMSSGAQVVVRGPAALQLESTNSVSLTRGQVTATVPPPAVGFTVRTPCSQVVDLGTEFVVQVDDAGATAVQVLRGDVEMSAQRDDDHQRWPLSSGQYKWVSADGAQDLDWRMELIVDSKTFQGHLHLNGQEFTFAKVEEFLPVYIRVTQELHQLRQLVTESRDAFRAEIHINGQRATITNLAQYLRAYRRFSDQLRDLWADALQRGTQPAPGMFQGSFHWNGREFRFNVLEDLQRMHEEIQRRAADGSPTFPPNRDDK